MKLKVQTISKAKVQSSAGFLLQSSDTPKLHNVVTAKLNLDRRKNELKVNLDSAIHPGGRFKIGRKTSRELDERIL